MSKRSFLLAQFIAVVSLCTAAYAQNAPSVADAARQARKDKAQSASSRVFTNDDLPAVGNDGAPSVLGAPAAAGTAKVVNFESAQSALDDAETKIARLDSMDRATLVKAALLQVKDAD